MKNIYNDRSAIELNEEFLKNNKESLEHRHAGKVYLFNFFKYDYSIIYRSEICACRHFKTSWQC